MICRRTQPNWRHPGRDRVQADNNEHYNPLPRLTGAVTGFTRTDLLVLLAAICFCAAIGISQYSAIRARGRSAQCIANLGKVGRAVLQFCAANRDTFPGNLSDEGRNLWWWYKEQVKAYAGLTAESSPNDHVFGCPDDRGYSDSIAFRLSPKFNYTSYVYNGVTLPGMPNIAGRPLAAVKDPKRTLLVMEWTAHAPLSWHKSKTGKQNYPFYSDAESVAGFVDGHVSFTRIYYDGFNPAYTRNPIPGYAYQYSAD